MPNDQRRKLIKEQYSDNGMFGIPKHFYMFVIFRQKFACTKFVQKGQIFPHDINLLKCIRICRQSDLMRLKHKVKAVWSKRLQNEQTVGGIFGLKSLFAIISHLNVISVYTWSVTERK